MKGVIFEQFGPPEVLRVRNDLPKPERKPGQGRCLVQIASTSVNPIDYKTRKGEVPRFMVKLPNVLGGDLSGVVVESDEGSKFPPGTRVFGCTEGFQLYSREGCYSEYFCAPENQLAVVPANTTLSDAGALPLVSLTAWQSLEAASLSPGNRLLIHAGAGGVGSVAIQIAKARGLHVTTTCSTRNIDFCTKELGADVAIDYTTQQFEEVCKNEPFDAVIDLIGGSVEIRSMKVLKKTGTMVTVLNSGWIKERGVGMAPLFVLYHLAKNKMFGTLRLGPKYKVILVSPNGEQMAEVATLLESRNLKPIIDRKVPLEEVVEAHKYMEQGHARGKVVLIVNPALE